MRFYFWLQKQWYQKNLTVFTLLLKPFSYLFLCIIIIRRFFYRIGIFKIIRLPVPVIVIGNLTVGGTGKTPFVIWLSNYLKNQGFSVGIITRGVGGKKNDCPVLVNKKSCPKQVGDEAILLARRTHCPVMVSSDRILASQILLKKKLCQIILSDDGLQNYRLGRVCEIVMMDADRQWGNENVLPAGPLREPLKRLRTVDFVIRNGIEMHLTGNELVSVRNSQKKISIDLWKGQRVHAIAAIGYPQRFFDCLIQMNISIIPHPFPDHYLFKKEDIFFKDNLPVIMTEKDAVKCEEFATDNHWYFPVDVQFEKTFQAHIMKKILESIQLKIASRLE